MHHFNWNVGCPLTFVVVFFSFELRLLFRKSETEDSEFQKIGYSASDGARIANYIIQNIIMENNKYENKMSKKHFHLSTDKMHHYIAKSVWMCVIDLCKYFCRWFNGNAICDCTHFTWNWWIVSGYIVLSFCWFVSVWKDSFRVFKVIE